MLPDFLQGILAAYYQLLEAFREGGLKGMLHSRFFWKRQATPVEMNLSTVRLPADIFGKSGYEFVELKLEDLYTLTFSVPSRGLKSSRNLKRGWRGFALIQGNQVIGDVWCVTPTQVECPVIHSDIAMLGITCDDKDAYAFDMQISPDHHGEYLAGPFQCALQATLKAEGCSKVYGYYWDDNLPARWMHRILKFKELPKRQVSRFLFYQKADTIPNTGRATKGSARPHVKEPRAGDSRNQLQNQK
jgi:hypothetical protein